MNPRDIAENTVEDLNRTSSPHALLWFLTITHADLSVPVRIVSDQFDYEVGGNTYKGMPFDGRPMTDIESQPFGQLVIQNIDATVSRELENATSRAQVALTVYSSADFDFTQKPRVPFNTPAKVYGFEQFELTEIEVTSFSITGRITLQDFAREPYPKDRATQARFPGLFI